MNPERANPVPGIAVNCPVCAAKMSAPPRAAGHKVRCPKCSEPITVPKSAPGTRPAPSGPVTPIDAPKSAAGRPRQDKMAERKEEPLPVIEVVPDSDNPVDDETRRCPFCDEQIRKAALKCRYCGESLKGYGRPKKGKKGGGGTFFQIIGALLLVGGLLSTVSNYNRDTTVEVPPSTFMGETIGGGRVHNIGLMQQRQTGITLSVAVAAAGFFSLLVGSVLARK